MPKTNSRSDPPSQPWLEPNIRDALREMHAEGARHGEQSVQGQSTAQLETADPVAAVRDLVRARRVEAEDLLARLGRGGAR